MNKSRSKDYILHNPFSARQLTSKHDSKRYEHFTIVIDEHVVVPGARGGNVNVWNWRESSLVNALHATYGRVDSGALGELMTESSSQGWDGVETQNCAAYTNKVVRRVCLRDFFSHDISICSNMK